jgi:hypothetical protein
VRQLLALLVPLLEQVAVVELLVMPLVQQVVLAAAGQELLRQVAQVVAQGFFTSSIKRIKQ